METKERNYWFVAVLTHQKYTNTCVDFLKRDASTSAWDTYVPAKLVEHVYANRTKRKVTHYFIPRTLFITGPSEEVAYDHVRNNPYIEHFMPERAVPRTESGRLRLGMVSNADINRLKKAIEGVKYIDDLQLIKEKLTSDSIIEVKQGELAGLFGNYIHDDNKDYLCFALGRLGNIMVRVDIKDCVVR